MFAKIFAILLGIFGVVTTTVESPVQPAPVAPKIVIVATEKIAGEKIATTSSNKATVKTNYFSQLKSASTTPNKSATTISTSTAEVQIKKPNVIPVVASPKSAEAPPLSAVLPTSTLSTSTPKNLPEPAVNFEPINQKARQAIVNILCTSQTGGSFQPLSGSGVVIDPRGIILTNAHIAQYLLLENYRAKNFLTCVARTGSPAVPAYTLKLLYISPRWLQANYKNITSQNPTGTGENDFALLAITGRTNPDSSLPASFPYLAINSNDEHIKTAMPVLLAGYPAGFLGGIAIQRELYIVSTVVNIGRRFTFTEGGQLDVFSLGGSPVAQKGSSGGAVVSSSEKLLGIIVTSTNATETSTRDLEAISIAHVSRSLFDETGLALNSLLASNLENFSAKFDEEALPGLQKLLIDELDSKNR